MKYEKITRSETKIIGLAARTNNASPDMGVVIGGLWHQFYEDGIYEAIQEKKTGKVLGIYTDYESDETGDYTFMTAYETGAEAKTPEHTVEKMIPAGTYAKFVVKGDLHKAVGEFWHQLWEMDLNRAYICDFEEYQTSSMEDAEIHIYIGLKES